MAHDALGGYGGHVLVGMVDALATFEPQRDATAAARSFGSAAVSLSSGLGIARD
jgi:hypothetical protein